MRKRITRNLAVLNLGIALCVLPVLAAQAQLPFDPSAIDQLTPEQRQKALETLGASGSTNSQARPDGRFRDRTLDDTTDDTSRRFRRDDRQTNSGNLRDRNCDELRGSRSTRDGYGANAGSSRRDDRLDDCRRSNNRQDNSAFSGRNPRLARNDEQTLDDAVSDLRPFGYDLFLDAATTFAPATDIPIPNDYVLGPGDSIHVQLFGNDNGNYSLLVGRDGTINFPKLGPISVAGQHFDAVKAALSERITRELIGVRSSISLGELRSVRVFLFGDVNQPGSYTVSSLSTITNALLVGGGVSTVGSLRSVQLKRAGRVIRTLDLYALLLRGDSSGDERLQPGDVIFVPPVGPRVSAAGEVKRPAIYELKDEHTVGDIIALAGGLPATTNTGTAQIERYEGNKKKVQQVDIARAADLGARIHDGDILRVGAIAPRLDNNVRIIGYVKYPGSFQWLSGYELKALLQAAQIESSDTKTETYLALGLVERTDPVSGVRGWLSFNVSGVMAADAPSFPMQRDDLVIILNREDIAYLDSRDVRDVAAGNFAPVGSCPALEGLAHLVNSERSIRFLKAFTSESTRDDKGERGNSRNNGSNNSYNGYNGYNGNDASNGANGVNGPNGIVGANGTIVSNGTNGINDLTGSNGFNNTNGYSGNNSGNGSNGRYIYRNSNGDLGPLRGQFDDQRSCPEIFMKAPRALQYLLEESVAVFGEVRRPGLYPVAANTPLNLLIETAGGLSNESDASNIEYVSYADALKSGASHYKTIDLKQSGAFDLRVNPGDVFNFKPLYLGQEVGTVKISGELKFPGSYGILRGERLSQLIQRAGGLTSDSYAYGAIFTRISARRAEEESYRRAASDLQEAAVTALTSGALGKDGQVSAQFLGTVAQRLQDAKAIGRVVIEADPTVLQARPEIDPILEPGDVLLVPKRPISVTVIGQVLNPGSQAFAPGSALRDYVDRAGGYSQAADEGRVFVILPNGTAQKFKTSFWNYKAQDIPPGSLIVVPRDAAPFNGLAFSERIFGVLSNLALTAAALATVSR